MRAHLYRVLQSLTGSLVTGATVTVFEPGTTTLIAQTIYADATSTKTISNPFQSANGLVDFYLANAQDVDLQIVYGAAALLAERQPVLPSASALFASAAPLTLTNTPNAGWVLAAMDSTHATWVDPSTLVTGTMNTAMPTPSTPVVSTHSGLSFVSWNGLDNTGASMPVGFAYAVLSEVGDTPQDLAVFLRAGAFVLPVAGGASLQLVAVNQAGVVGPPSQLVTYPSPTVLVSAGNVQATVGAAGTAAHLPSAPSAYQPIVGSDGVTYVVAVYQPS